MSDELLKAHLNLYAVLQNIEDLVRLDPEMAALTKPWDVSIQFKVRGGPEAFLFFQDGQCRHKPGHLNDPAIRLFFTSPAHLNRMFDDNANPIPLKGFTRLRFLTKEFKKLTDRLTYYLKPDSARLADPEYMRINTILTLNTATFAVKELAELEPVSKKIAEHTPKGALQIEILPDGPCTSVTFEARDILVGKKKVEHPMARMAFKDIAVANKLLSGNLDAFLAVAEGDVTLQGQLPMIDNIGLILDRVPLYLS